MGQYYECVNLDKEEYLEPWDYNNGFKLMEHSYVGNNYVNTIEKLLSPSNPWHKTRIVWAGDYIDSNLFLDNYTLTKDMTLYSYAKHNFTKIKPKSEDNQIMRYIVNHTKKEYVDKAKILLKFGQNFTIHPLPLLTAPSNGGGGGDYFSNINKEYIGTWAGNTISIGSEAPKDYEELKIYFK